MPVFFHPHIVQLIDLADDLLLGHGCWANFQAAVAQAQAMHCWQRERFLHFRQGQKRTPDLECAAEQASHAFEERERALIELATGTDDLEALTLVVQRASQRIARASEELETLLAEERLSDFPILADFLQVGQNVIDDHESPEVLASRLPALVSWVRDLALDWDLERDLFPELAEHGHEFERIIEGLKHGVGAIMVFLDEVDATDLAAGLEQLLDSGHSLAAFFSHIAPLSQTTRSPYHDIERWVMKHEQGSPDLEAARQAVLILLESQQRQLEDLGELPYDADEYIATFELLETAVSDQLQALEVGDVEGICQASQTHRGLLLELSGQLTEASADLEEAPALRELRRIVLGVYYQQTPRRFLVSMLDTLAPGFQTALAGEAEPAAREALQTCLEAMEHAYTSLEEGSVNGLVEAWRALNRGGATLVFLQQERERLLLEEAERRLVTCVQCGARSEPSVKVCACGAQLWRALEQSPSSFSFADQSSEPEQPRHLQELLVLASRIQGGLADQEEIRATVDPHIARAKQILAQASQAGASGAFRLGVSKFQSGLQRLALQADQRDLAELASGVDLLMEGSQEIRSIGANQG